MPPQITGIDGTVYNTSDIVFDAATQTFSYGQEDISLNLKRADQLLWTSAGFDVTTYNNTLSQRAHPGPAGGSTSTVGNFVSQLVNDPLAAPTADLQSAYDAVTQPFVNAYDAITGAASSAVDTTTTYIKYAAIGAAVLVAFLIFRKK